MTLNSRQLDLRIADSALALSARRIWEHTEFGQVNPFAAIPQSGPVQPEAYVDIVNMSGSVQMLTGLTLDDALADRHCGVVRVLVKQVLRHVGSATVRQWLENVRLHLVEFAQQRAVRNMPQSFLAADSASPFGVRGLHSALKDWLHEHRADKAGAEQWRQRIENLTQEGLRADELAFCGLNDTLPDDTDRVLDGDAIAECVQIDALRLSILPVVRPAHAQLEFVRVPANAGIKRIKPKLKAHLHPRPQWRDRVLGYWIDVVEWSDLLGPMRGWMAFTHRGEPIGAPNNPSGLCTSLEEAKRLANRDAEMRFPKLSTQDEWSDSRLTGGADYREWLVTLPYYAPSYFTSHFSHRNVLLHMRCDMREGPDGERVLLLQEVQSDWALQARRDRKEEGAMSAPTSVPPWLHEWPALALKLMLLHAAQNGVQTLAWTTGDIQVKRYGGLGRAGLTELYDRTMPAEADRLLRALGGKCERVEYFRRANFYIEPTDLGYDVLDQRGDLVGSAASWQEAQGLLPDGAHELLTPMHGVALTDELRRAILERGFFAWGLGCSGQRHKNAGQRRQQRDR